MNRIKRVVSISAICILCGLLGIEVSQHEAFAAGFQLEQTITPAGSGSKFGSSLALSGNEAIIGGAGFAEIQRFSNGQWSNEATLSPSGGVGFYASDVDIFGNLAIVGDWNRNLAYIYRYNGTKWLEETQLTPSGDGPFTGFGSSVALSANRVVVGAFGDGGSGAAYVYKFDQGSWSLEQKLSASDIAHDDFFGQSVDISGNTILVGSSAADATAQNSGAAYFYDFDGNNWQQTQKVSGQAAFSHRFGSDVALDGTRAVIGSWGDSYIGAFAGSAYVYDRTLAGWSQTAKLIADNGTTRDAFGTFVSLSGDYVIVGTGDNDGQDPNPQPAAYLYAGVGNAWSQIARVPTPGNGVPVGIDGLRFMTGSQIPIGLGTVQSYLISIPEPTTAVLLMPIVCALYLRRPGHLLKRASKKPAKKKTKF
jgi:hypothetical protein